MNSASQHLIVLLDKATLQNMRVNEMIGRLDQIRATGRYANIHVDYRQREIIAELIA